MTWDELPELLLPREAMQVMRVSKNTFYLAVASGAIPAIRLGPRGLRVPKAALRAQLDATTSPSSASTEPALPAA